MPGSREIVNAEALRWLRGAQGPFGVVTSPPDAEEIGTSVADWAFWFRTAIHACIKASAGPVVFYVTDRKHAGQLWSKAAMVLRVAETTKTPVAWHKVALRRDVGKADIHRPGYSHMIALGAPPGKATPDTIHRGRVLYPNGTGVDAAEVAVAWALKHQRTIVDPFCGRGTIPVVVEAMGGHGVGVDLDPEQCKHARALRLTR